MHDQPPPPLPDAPAVEGGAPPTPVSGVEHPSDAPDAPAVPPAEVARLLAEPLADLREQVRRLAAHLAADEGARVEQRRTRDALLDAVESSRPSFLLRQLRPFVHRLAQLADCVGEWERNPPADADGVARCLAALGQQVREAFAVHDIREVRPADGDPFDPRCHFAVDTRPTADPDRHERIAAVLQHGYLYFGEHDRTGAVVPALIRPARVLTWAYQPAAPTD